MQPHVTRWSRIAIVLASGMGAWSCGSDTANKSSPLTGGGASSASGGSTSSAGAVSSSGGALSSSGGALSSSGGALSNGGAAPAGKGVTVTPANARVDIGGHVQFSALVVGVTDSSVTWSVQEGMTGGTISGSGLYTAPTNSGSFHVVATSSADSTLSGSTTVTAASASGTPPVLKSGLWVDLTPPTLNLKCCPSNGGNSYGLPYFDIDPGDARTIYVCVDTLGLWKTTDGGSTWALLGNPKDKQTDTAATYLDSPIVVKVDPQDSTHLYATQGVRGVTLGFWVSHDSGKTWKKPQGFVDVAKTTTNDVTVLSVDPSDFNHILLGSHSIWPGLTNSGFVESTDGGNNWTVHQPMPKWVSGSMGIHFLYSPENGIGDSKTWLVSTDGGGFWKTVDAGKNWKLVSDNNIAHGGNQLYYSKTGWLYAGATSFPVRSHDNGDTWERLDKTLPNATYYTVFGDGTNLYTQISYTGDNGKGGELSVYYTSPESDGVTWTPMPGGQKFTDGPFLMKFDSANKIMYSSNWDAGFLALKIP